LSSAYISQSSSCSRELGLELFSIGDDEAVACLLQSGLWEELARRYFTFPLASSLCLLKLGINSFVTRNIVENNVRFRV
jgi:hypothetical protein